MSFYIKFALPFITLLYLASSGQYGKVEAWQALQNFHNEAHPGKCTINERLIISPGEKVKSPFTCAEITCNDQNGLATITGCGAVAAPAGCEWHGYVNENAEFPECCAQYLKCRGGVNDEKKDHLQQIWNMFSTNLKVANIPHTKWEI